MSDPSTYDVFLLNPITGEFSSLGMYALGSGSAVGVVVEGPTPRFFYTTPITTYALPLPV